MATKTAIIRRTTYDFGALEAGGEQTLVLRRSIPAPQSRGTLMVRVHDVSVGGGSDGDVTIAVRADGFTPNDPAQLFFGEALASVTVAADGSSAPAYLVETFAVASDHLMVQIEALQDGSSALALSARVSVDLLLDDAPLDADEWTPAALSPEGWWRADLGHALADSDPVTSWANQGTAGASGDVGQGNATLQPIFVASHASFNGQSVIDFDGADVLYATAGTWWYLSASDDSATLVTVCRPTYSGTAVAVVCTRNFGTQGGMRLQVQTTGTNQCEFNCNDGSSGVIDKGATVAQNATASVAGTLDGQTSPGTDTVTCWVDGASNGGTTGDLGVIAAANPREWCIGGFSTTAGQLPGEVAEVVYVKRRLSVAEDASLTSYLNARYGLSLSGVTR